MSNFAVGLSGLTVAQQALELIGTNISNAATEGYHRQELRIAPVMYNTGVGGMTTGGAEVVEVRRNLDILLELELVRQNPQYSQIDQERIVLEGVEAALGDMDSEGLTKGLADFFSAVDELAANPESQAFREQLLWAADGLAAQFRSISQFLYDLQENVDLEAQSYASQINNYAAEIADLNSEIHLVTSRGGNANILEDRRDQAVLNLSELLEVETTGQMTGTGVTNVTAWGMPLVSGHQSYNISVGTTADDELGVSLESAKFYTSAVTGGRLGAMIALRNNLIPKLREKLDTLAQYVIQEVNRVHVEGIGSHGSFDELNGWVVSNQPLGDWNAGMTDGSVFVRVIDTDTGVVERYEVPVATTDTIADFRDALNGAGVPHVSASIVGSALHVEAEDGYQFDFLPALIAQPLSSTLGVNVDVSGIYGGSENQIFTVTVTGAAGPQNIGESSNLRLEVRDGSGDLVKTLSIGSGYAAGDRLEISEGMFVQLEAGTVSAGESFTVQALASSDTSGILAATGLNTFFRGNSAQSMYVEDDILADSSRLATSIGQEMTDNLNMLRIAKLDEQSVPQLGGTTISNYLRQIVVGVGQDVATRQSRGRALETVIKQVLNHRESISGVDINEQAANLMMFENMFQAVAKFFASQDKVMQTLMDIL